MTEHDYYSIGKSHIHAAVHCPKCKNMDVKTSPTIGDRGGVECITVKCDDCEIYITIP